MQISKFFSRSPEVRSYEIPLATLLALANSIQNPYLAAAAQDNFFFAGGRGLHQIQLDYVERGWLIDGKKRIGIPKYMAKNVTQENVRTALRAITTRSNAEKIELAHSQNPAYLASNTISFGMEGGLDQSGIIIKQPDEHSVTQNLLIGNDDIKLLCMIDKFPVVDASSNELLGYIRVSVQALFTLKQINNTWGFQLSCLKTSNEVFHRMLTGKLVQASEVKALIEPSRPAETNNLSASPSVVDSKDQAAKSSSEPNIYGLDPVTHKIILSYDFASELMNFLRRNSAEAKDLGLIISVLHSLNLLTVKMLNNISKHPDNFKEIATMLTKFQELGLFNSSVKQYLTDNENGIFYVARVASVLVSNRLTDHVRLLAKNITHGGTFWLVTDILERSNILTQENVRLALENPVGCKISRPFFENMLIRREVADNPRLASKIFQLFIKYPYYSAHIHKHPHAMDESAIDLFEQTIISSGRNYSADNVATTTEIAEFIKKSFDYIASTLSSASSPK